MCLYALDYSTSEALNEAYRNHASTSDFIRSGLDKKSNVLKIAINA
jgi:hypothetical protein